MFQLEFQNVIVDHNPNVGQDLFPEIEKAYTHHSRHYHTLAHLDQLVSELKPLRDQFSCWPTVVFAIAYHDFVYNATRKDNEEKSAAFAAARLKQIAFPESEIERCLAFINATKKHQPVNREVDLFTDADLSILGATPGRYQNYAAEVRKEYSVYPDLLYKPGRKKVLLHFLAMNRIYKTNEFYEKYEVRARINMESELHL
ncbi:MAG: hypothetical protein KF856_02685 [Cyclobacteriaceae bacterium]|nr:hypothetical protein [Cyclobacteriaceae bacterium]